MEVWLRISSRKTKMIARWYVSNNFNSSGPDSVYKGI
eukprot:COSAG05_NODE_4750_length_1386_cov_3.205905_3_plen_36_part_01